MLSPPQYSLRVAENIRSLDTFVREDHWPHTECPICRIGALQPESLQGVSTELSRYEYDQSHDSGDVRGSFHGVLRCSFAQCRETVVVAGDYCGGVDTYDDGRTGDFHFFRLRYASPALDILVPPIGTPDAVLTAIKAAAHIVWIDPSAAANRLRLAIDDLLTHEGVKRFVIKNHKRRRLTTHERITEFKRYDPQVGDVLEAVKWIGNAGSHERQLSATDVIDGAELLGYALRLLYDKSDAEMERRIRAVNKRKGLPKTTASR
jgi:hypothetical protein